MLNVNPSFSAEKPTIAGPKTKPEKPIYRDRVGQTIRGLLGLHIRNRILETAQPDQAQRVQQGARFSKGEKFTKLNLDLRRPGSGMPPIKILKIYGKKAKKNLNSGEMLKPTDIY